jgi:hypothetical protein
MNTSFFNRVEELNFLRKNLAPNSRVINFSGATTGGKDLSVKGILSPS